MHSLDSELLVKFAQKYIWWKTPLAALKHPQRIIAQVMNIGDYNDVQYLMKEIKKEDLKEILKTAEIGQFNEKSWHFWHYRLGIAQLGTVPDLPNDRFQ